MRVLEHRAHRAKEAVKAWEGGCTPSDPWFADGLVYANPKSLHKSWFMSSRIKRQRLSIVPEPVMAKKNDVLSPREVQERALSILRKAEAERNRISTEEAKLGISFE